jgi:hypothetical protein
LSKFAHDAGWADVLPEVQLQTLAALTIYSFLYFLRFTVRATQANPTVIMER